MNTDTYHPPIHQGIILKHTESLHTHPFHSKEIFKMTKDVEENFPTSTSPWSCGSLGLTSMTASG